MWSGQVAAVRRSIAWKVGGTSRSLHGMASWIASRSAFDAKSSIPSSRCGAVGRRSDRATMRIAVRKGKRSGVGPGVIPPGAGRASGLFRGHRGGELEPREPGVEPALGDQRDVRALRHQAPALEHQDAVGGLHCREPVRDHQSRAPLREPLHRRLHEVL